MDAGGFAFGTDGLKSAGGLLTGAAGLVISVSAFGAGSFNLFLENISSCLDKNHWVNGFSTNPYLIM